VACSQYVAIDWSLYVVTPSLAPELLMNRPNVRLEPRGSVTCSHDWSRAGSKPMLGRSLPVDSLNRTLRKTLNGGTGIGKSLLQRRQGLPGSRTDASQPDAGGVSFTFIGRSQQAN
jgi:hypothetical protein